MHTEQPCMRPCAARVSRVFVCSLRLQRDWDRLLGTLASPATSLGSTWPLPLCLLQHLPEDMLPGAAAVCLRALTALCTDQHQLVRGLRTLGGVPPSAGSAR